MAYKHTKSNADFIANNKVNSPHAILAAKTLVESGKGHYLFNGRVEWCKKNSVWIDENGKRILVAPYARNELKILDLNKSFSIEEIWKE